MDRWKRLDICTIYLVQICTVGDLECLGQGARYMSEPVGTYSTNRVSISGIPYLQLMIMTQHPARGDR